MNLEQFIAQRNGITFWKEFTFAQLKFRVPSGEVELADNVVWFGETAFIIQMKEREGVTEDPDTERRWFDKKVLKAAVKRIKDSLRFLDERGGIPVANVRGQEMTIAKDRLRDVRKLIVSLATSYPTSAGKRSSTSARLWDSSTSSTMTAKATCLSLLSLQKKSAISEHSKGVVRPPYPTSSS
ncbi:hypothetical protein [Ensifer sp. Root127]|uniref:hypothetical protein n=1 Tax=Ensifer sp. Root127 TaxID=1736440 RepID=UPI0007106D11|nr:hypothetical protein [Ensifer sp. Root127]KQW60729.1 hypothetical protein ASD03_36790 [Ensifer sp. Root127]